MKKSDYQIAKELREKWGNKPCSCDKLTQERLSMGQGTGDYYCIQCGKWFLPEDLRNRKKD